MGDEFVPMSAGGNGDSHQPPPADADPTCTLMLSVDTTTGDTTWKLIGGKINLQMIIGGCHAALTRVPAMESTGPATHADEAIVLLRIDKETGWVECNLRGKKHEAYLVAGLYMVLQRALDEVKMRAAMDQAIGGVQLANVDTLAAMQGKKQQGPGKKYKG